MAPKLDILRKQGILVAVLYAILWTYGLVKTVWVINRTKSYYSQRYKRDYYDYGDRESYESLSDLMPYDLTNQTINTRNYFAVPEYGLRIGFIVYSTFGILFAIQMIIGILKNHKIVVTICTIAFGVQASFINCYSLYMSIVKNDSQSMELTLKYISFTILSMYAIISLNIAMRKENTIKDEENINDTEDIDYDSECERIDNLPKYNPDSVQTAIEDDAV